ncbi:hypothetical protein FGX01_01090, partial [Xylella fastidiosa subsp. multiplex]|nr:hypothetical protein [Xylella fastidiosa subsp. multiplex]
MPVLRPRGVAALPALVLAAAVASTVTAAAWHEPSKSDPANGHGAVGAAEAERVGQADVDLHLPRLVGAV